MSELQQSVDRILEQYKAAVFSRDVSAFMRLYDPKARIFDAWGSWEYQDSAKWQIAIEGWFSSHTTEKFKVTFEDVQTQGSRDFAVVTATVSYASISPQGEQTRAMQNRLSWALRTSGHTLRIIHEHTSFPVGFEDLKAVLHKELKP